MKVALIVSLGLMASLILTSAAGAQESSLGACANGRDDDGDGRRDLEDTDCACRPGAHLFSRTMSVIPNPSFEDSSCCPTSHTQLNCADAWVQATAGTSDYLRAGCYEGNTGGIGMLPLPFPHGSSAVGTIFRNSAYIEYVGACTTSPIQPGVEYTFEFMVGAASGNSYGGDTEGELVLLGLRTCNLPISGQDSKEDEYDTLASQRVSLRAGAPYQRVTMTFVAGNRYDGVLIGPGQSMTLQSGYGGNYIVWDDLVLNSTSNFGSEVAVEGDCDVGHVLRGPAVSGVSYQWYRDSVAIPGATSQTYSVPPGEGGAYALRVDDGSTCNMASNAVAIDCGNCGDRLVRSAEECDDGGESPSCNDDCTLARCGDGKLNASAGEACDDGGESPTCDIDCTPSVCGDLVVNASAGEQCDEGPNTNSEFAACTPECIKIPRNGGGSTGRCGDGRIDASAGETCDDRNAEAGDGCDQCQTEEGWHCAPTCCRDTDQDGACDDLLPPDASVPSGSGSSGGAGSSGGSGGDGRRSRGGCSATGPAPGSPGAVAAISILLAVLITRRRRVPTGSRPPRRSASRARG